ncbi:MAG: RidA family protein [Myxococcota bacterium]
MPILDLTIVGPLDAARRERAAQRVADAAAAAFETGPGRCWARLRELDASDYAENGGPTEARPVFVNVLRHDLPPPVERAALAATLARGVAEALGRPRENVHVLFEPAAAGRVAFGGALTPGPPRHRAESGARWEAIVGYARAVRVGDLVWVTGSTAVDDAGEPVGLGDARAQATRCLEVVKAALETLGGSAADVVRTRMFVTDIARDWAAIGEAHAEVFGDVRPATTMVEVRKLIADWMLVEIEADACLGGPG